MAFYLEQWIFSFLITLVGKEHAHLGLSTVLGTSLASWVPDAYLLTEKNNNIL